MNTPSVVMISRSGKIGTAVPGIYKAQSNWYFVILLLTAFTTAAGDRIRPDMWSPEGKRPRTEPSLSLEKKRDLTLPVLVDEQDKFKVSVVQSILIWWRSTYIFKNDSPVLHNYANLV